MPSFDGGITFTIEGELTVMLAGNAGAKASASGTLTGGQTAGAAGFAEWPLFESVGTATSGRPVPRANGLSEWPLFSATGTAGARGRAVWPLFEAAGTATAPIIANGLAEWPLFSAEGTATSPILARGRADWPLFESSGVAGAVGDAEWTLFDAVGTASGEVLARGFAKWPLFESAGTASSPIIARGFAKWPLFESRGLAGALGVASWPLFESAGRASAEGVATPETTYAVNIATNAVTRWAIGPADRLITAHGALYVLRDGQLFCCDASTDAGQPIKAFARFAPQPVGTNHVKRASAVYLSARQLDGVIVELIADEVALWRYRKSPAPEMGYATHKISLGAGVQFYTAGLALRNRDGGALEVGGFEMLVQPLSKKPQ